MFFDKKTMKHKENQEHVMKFHAILFNSEVFLGFINHKKKPIPIGFQMGSKWVPNEIQMSSK